MKHIKSISLFLTYTMLLLILGFFSGIVVTCKLTDHAKQKTDILEADPLTAETVTEAENPVLPAASDRKEECLCADTEYVLEEYDLKRNSKVETVLKVPPKYLGMNREEFVAAMERYETSPPLNELERGFTGLEVLSFSEKRVVIRMNYVYVEPTTSFYLCLSDGKIVVFCDDRKTVYQYTDIVASKLPEALQTELIIGMFVEDEEALYRFLETYSS